MLNLVVEYNRRSTTRHPLKEPTVAPLGGHCGEMMEPEGREPTINIPLPLSQHPNRIPDGEHT